MDVMNRTLDGCVPLPHLGVIEAVGPDAARFLHGQLTQDFVTLDPSEARLAAFCSAKGRVQASFIGMRRGAEDVLLLCSADLLASVRTRLSMFVLRSKVRLNDASDAYRVCGLAGDALQALWPQPAQPWARCERGEASLVRLYPAGGVARALWVAPAQITPPTGDPLPLDVWRLSEVRAGVATVGAAVADAFVPQMLNYESIGGVSFKKGCYPGQEVVARSQFRGVLKRRALLAHCALSMAAGELIFSRNDPGQPCATVVQAAPCPEGGWDAIVSGQSSVLQSGVLELGASGGPAVQVRAMPYALLDDV